MDKKILFLFFSITCIKINEYENYTNTYKLMWTCIKVNEFENNANTYKLMLAYTKYKGTNNVKNEKSTQYHIGFSLICIHDYDGKLQKYDRRL